MFSTPTRPGSRRPAVSRRPIESRKTTPSQPKSIFPASVVSELSSSNDTAELSVFPFALAPLEVQRVLSSLDPETHGVSGIVDACLSLIVVATRDASFVWNYSTNKDGSSTCYIFPNPICTSYSRTFPSIFPQFIPHGVAKEPGLLLCSPHGELRYWDRIGTGITGAERFQSFLMNFAPSEFAVIMQRIEISLLIVGTSHGRLFQVFVSTIGGVSHLHATLLSRTHSVLSIVASSFFGSTAPSDSISGIAVVPTEQDAGITADHTLWILTQTHLQKWSISASTWEWGLDEDIITPIQNELLRQALDRNPSVSELQVCLLDLGLCLQDEVIVLVSITSPQDLTFGENTDVRATRFHALAKVSASGGTVKLKSLNILANPSASNEYSSPKMYLLDRGNTVVLRFDNALVIKCIAAGSAFHSTMLLKDPWDRLLDLGITSQKEISSITELMLMTAKHGVLACRIDLEKVRQSTPDTPTNHLRSVLEQGIFFGSMDENPFQTQLGHYTGETLALAAESLSRDILSSNSHLLRLTTDLRAQLSDRRKALETLVVFLNQNGALSQLPQVSRQQLANDAEKLFVTEDLWIALNDRIDVGLLSEAISNIIHNKMEQSPQDTMRLFFRHHAGEVEVIFEELQNICQQSALTLFSARVPTQLIEESCSIMIRMWSSAVRYRQQTQSIYCIDDSKIIITPWTSLWNQIMVAKSFFELIVRSLKDQRQDVETPVKSPESLTLILREMGSLALTMWQERYDYLASNALDTAGQSVLESFKVHFALVRNQILNALVQCGSVEAAYRLAEEYRDLTFLANLCNDPVYGDSTKVMALLQKHRGTFALPLFNWYIENGQLRKLLEIDSQFLPLLEAYLRTTKHPRIQWIHDLGVGSFDAAASALEAESEREPKREIKHVILSVAKLCSLASMDDANSETTQHALQNLNIQLDLISIHDRILTEFFGGLRDVELTRSSETMSEGIIRAYATSLVRSRPGYLSVFKNLVKSLCQGQVLSGEELIEILTLRDHFAGCEDFVQAFQIAATYKEPSPQLRTAIQSINRRLFVASEWVEITKSSNRTDNDIDERLRRTLLYQTLRSLGRESCEDVIALCLWPTKVSDIPHVSQIEAQYPSLTATQVSDFEVECRSEVAVLENLLHVHSFESWYLRVRSLAGLE